MDSPHLKITRFAGRELAGTPFLPFVSSTFCKSMGRPWWNLWRFIKKPGALILIAEPAEGDPLYVGWLACVPTANRVVFAFTKAAYRASPEQRRGKREENADAFRIASSLAIAGGINFDRPVSCSFWSRAARAIAEKPGNPYRLLPPECSNDQDHRFRD